MLLGIFYELALWTLAMAAIPKMLYQRFVHGKYRNSLSKRFGFGFPNITKGDRKLIWIHAVSVGETKVVASLAKLLKNSPGNPIIVVSSITETGHVEAQRSMPFADYHVYLPFDLYSIISPIIRRAKPELVILSESDFWYNFLRSSKSHGASVAVVNGKISQRSADRFRKLKLFTNALFSCVDLLCTQNLLYQERFVEVGIPAQKLIVTGNMKFDESYPKLNADEIDIWRRNLGIKASDQVLVVGSTHDPEELLILDALKEVWQHLPHLKVLIVPRHPERFLEVAMLLHKKEIPFIRFSNFNANTGEEKVILIDAMGQLRRCYQLADLAIVGGSFTDKVGGHNIIEPCWYGVPVLFGPHMHTQLELVSLVKQYNAGIQVNKDNLTSTLLSILKDPEKRAKYGKGGELLVSEMQGATAKTWQAISDLM